MAVIKKNELKQLETGSLKAKLAEVQAALAEEYSTLNTSRRSKVVKYRSLRKTVAKIKTLLRQRGVKE